MALNKSKKSPILNERKKLSGVVPLDIPYSVTMHLTTKCNSRCIFCDIHSSTSPKLLAEDMDFQVAQEVVLQLKRHGKKIKALHISGIGEPLLNSDIIKIVKYAKKAGITEGCGSFKTCLTTTIHYS